MSWPPEPQDMLALSEDASFGLISFPIGRASLGFHGFPFGVGF